MNSENIPPLVYNGHTLFMTACHVKGPIPESLNIAQSLVIARLNGNNLSGGIPESLFDGMSTNTLEHQNIEEKPFMNLVEFRVHGELSIEK